MRKTFCDGCGQQCVNTVVVLHASVQHQTSSGAQVGWDETKPVELCTDCFEPIQKMLNIEIQPQPVDGYGPDMARAMPVPPPLHMSEVP